MLLFSSVLCSVCFFYSNIPELSSPIDYVHPVFISDAASRKCIFPLHVGRSIQLKKDQGSWAMCWGEGGGGTGRCIVIFLYGWKQASQKLGLKVTDKGLCANPRGLWTTTHCWRGRSQFSKKAHGLGSELRLCPDAHQSSLGIYLIIDFCPFSFFFLVLLPFSRTPVLSSPLELSVHFG